MGACIMGEAGRDYNRVDMSMQRLWEEYLPSYKACVDAGARAIMRRSTISMAFPVQSTPGCLGISCVRSGALTGWSSVMPTPLRSA